MSSSADTQQAPIFHFSKALFFSVFVSLSKHNNDKSEGQLKKGKKKKKRTYNSHNRSKLNRITKKKKKVYKKQKSEWSERVRKERKEKKKKSRDYVLLEEKWGEGKKRKQQ